MTNSYGAGLPPAEQPTSWTPATWDPLVGSPARPPGGYAPTAGPAPVWVPPTPVYPYAVWIRRVAAYLIDFAPSYVALVPWCLGLGLVYASLIRVATTRGSTAAATPVLTSTPLTLLAVGFVLMLAALGWQWHNRWLTAGRTGQSMGKRVLHTKLVAEINGQPIGALNAFLRDLLHTLDALAYLGFLWPLWDTKRQTFADMIMKTVVTDLGAPPGSTAAARDQAPVGAA